ncbi:long-chain-fatty-acid--CoA ligase [Stackebrandtia soli]|uniref:long-chain-fatty-acid--CoA ligase n=1 Tax=Stackebrandtia soli TaxID=1892856 RepID=UPI0039E99C5B
MLNLAVLLEDSTRSVPDRVAVVAGDTRLTYAQVEAAASQVADALRAAGVGPGDRVALTCPNTPHFPIVYYGILKLGAIVVPLNVLSSAREIAYYLRDSESVAYLCFEGTPDLPMAKAGYAAFSEVDECRTFVTLTIDPGAPSPFEGSQTLSEFTAGRLPSVPSVPTSETDTAVILYTSGTTGSPKGAELTHSNMIQNVQVCHRLFGLGTGDTYLVALPLFHSFAQTVQMNAGFGSESTLVLMPRFAPDAALASMERERVTMFAGVPTMYWALLNHPDAASYDLAAIAERLRLAVCGGSPLPAEVIDGFEKRFGVPILEGYGLSESSPVATFSRTDRPRRVGSIGFPVWGTQAKVMREDGTEADVDEPGEIWLRGHHIMKGYLGRPDDTAEVLDSDGWFRTGDVARRDSDGYLYIVDRIKDMIIRNGLNVYPREVEEVLMTHPAVSLAAVVGVPHESQGEEVKAYIIRAAGAELSTEELIDWAREQLATFKYPRLVEFRDSFPMTASGKILKRQL